MMLFTIWQFTIYNWFFYLLYFTILFEDDVIYNLTIYNLSLRMMFLFIIYLHSAGFVPSLSTWRWCSAVPSTPDATAQHATTSAFRTAWPVQANGMSRPILLLPSSVYSENPYQTWQYRLPYNWQKAKCRNAPAGGRWPGLQVKQAAHQPSWWFAPQKPSFVPVVPACPWNC